MSKLKIGLYLAAIFAAGFVTGVFVTVQVARHMMPDQAQMAARWCKDLQSKMSLTPAQVEKIRPVINVTLNNLRNRLSGDMLQSLSNCNALITVELTPEQKPKFDEIQKQEYDMALTIFGGGTNEPHKRP